MEQQPATTQIMMKQVNTPDTRPEVPGEQNLMANTSVGSNHTINTANIQDQDAVLTQNETVRIFKFIFNYSKPMNTSMNT